MVVLFRCVLLSMALTVSTFAQVVDTTVLREDGVSLDALYILPQTPPPPGGYPAILLVHGFGGNKNQNRLAAQLYAAQGYACAAYSVRGQGASGGAFDFFSSETILEDLRAMVAMTSGLPSVNADRVGVEGGSQGGLHAWMAAAHGMNVRAVSSIIANGRFAENWMADGTMNYRFAAAMQTDQVRIVQWLRDSVRRAVETGDHSFVRPFLASQSTAGTEASVTTPVAMFFSYHDGFFNPTPALTQARQLSGPRRIVAYPGGHSLPPLQSTAAYVQHVRDRWWAYWLKDEQRFSGVADPDSSVVLFDGGTGASRVYALEDSAYWSATRTTPSDLVPVSFALADDSLHATIPAAAGWINLPYVVLLGSTPVTVRSAPMEEDVTIAAVPAVAHIYATATTRRFQVNVLLLDYDPATGQRRHLTRGQVEVEDSDLLEHEWVDVPLNSVLHTLRAGHQLEVRIHSGTALLPDFGVHFGNTPVPPPTSSLVTIHTGTDRPSRIDIHRLVDLPAAVRPVPSAAVSLHVPYPHPLRSEASVRVDLPAPAWTELGVFDIRGRRVASLLARHLSPGSHVFSVDVSSLRPGTYFLRLTSGGELRVRPMQVLR